jgi:hypothetical protein
MASFNNTLAIVASALMLIPLFFFKKTLQRIIIIVLAVICFAGVRYLSQTYLYPHYLGWKFEKEITQQPLFALIEKNNPKQFKEFVSKVQGALQVNADPNLIAAYSSQLVNEFFFQYLKNAPNEAVSQYLKATLELYRYLATKDPRMIVKFENENGLEKVDLDTLWKDATFQQYLLRLLETKQQVILLGMQKPVQPPTAKDAEPLLHKVLHSLSEKYGKDNVKRMFGKDQKQIPDDQLGNFIIDFYTGIMEQGQESEGIIMRYLGSLKIPTQS